MVHMRHYFMALRDDKEYIETDRGIFEEDAGELLIQLIDIDWEEWERKLETECQKESATNAFGEKFAKWFKDLCCELEGRHRLFEVFLRDQMKHDMQNIAIEYETVGEQGGIVKGATTRSPEYRYTIELMSDDDIKSKDVNEVFLDRAIKQCSIRIGELNKASKVLENFVQHVLLLDNSKEAIEQYYILHRYADFRLNCEKYDYIVPDMYKLLSAEVHVSVGDTVISRARGEHSDGYEEMAQRYKNLKHMKPRIQQVWATDSLSALAYMEFDYMAQEQFFVRLCTHCGRYFVPHSKAERYCNRQLPDDLEKTCKSIGAKSAFQRKVDEDEAKKLFIRVNNRIQTWVGRQKGNGILRIKYDKWKKMAEDLLEDVSNGRLAFEVFKDKLDKGSKESLTNIMLSDEEVEAHRNTAKRLWNKE